MAQDTANATQHTKRAHRLTEAKWPRTPHTHACLGRPRERQQQTTTRGSGALGQLSRPIGPQG